MKRNFANRYWQVFLALAALVMAVLNNHVFAWLGTLVYLPALCLGVVAMALLCRWILHRDTTEPYIRSGHYSADFNDLDPRERVWLTAIQYFVYLAAFAIIAAALLK